MWTKVRGGGGFRACDSGFGGLGFTPEHSLLTCSYLIPRRLLLSLLNLSSSATTEAGLAYLCLVLFFCLVFVGIRRIHMSRVCFSRFTYTCVPCLLLTLHISQLKQFFSPIHQPPPRPSPPLMPHTPSISQPSPTRIIPRLISSSFCCRSVEK